MNEVIDISNTEKKLEDLINEANLLIFDEEIWKKKELWKVAEVTYSYISENKESKNKINTTLFVSLGELNLEEYLKSDEKNKKILLLKAKKRLIQILNNKKELINNSLDEIKIFDYFSSNTVEANIRDIFINSLIEKRDFLDYTLNAIDFELEKAGVKNNLSKKEEKKLQKKITKIDSKLFGGNIKDNPLEVKLAYEYIYDIYIEKNEKLTSLEKERFNKYLDKVKKYLPEGYTYNKKEKPQSIGGEFLDIEIPREDYIFGFNILIEAISKLKHIAETNQEVKSISDGPQKVQFPIGEKYNFMNILRFFKLGNHEFETHSITDYNSNQLMGNMRGANSTEKDEGLAMLMEQIFTYGSSIYKKDIDKNGKKVYIIDVNKIQINSYFTKTLMGELLNNDELLDFLEIVEKIDPDVSNVQDRFYRLKRNNKYGVQHKDTTYTRGLFKAIKEINLYIKSAGEKGIKPEDLFLGKISFQETHKLKEIKKEKERSGEKTDIVKPLFISDAVYYIISEKLKGNEKINISSDGFIKYLKNKYPIFDFSEDEIKNISYKTKRNIFGIVNIIMKNIDKNNIKKINLNHNSNIFTHYNIKEKQIRKKMSYERKKAK